MDEWAVLDKWQNSPASLRGVDLAELRGRLQLVGRARASLAAFEASLVAEISRREGDAAAEEILRRDQKRSLPSARKAVKVAAQLEWAPGVADKLAEGAITPEAAGLILDAAAEAPVDQGALLEAAEDEPDDLFRRTLKEHVNERTSEQELQERRERQRRRRRASITEQPDGMFHLFASLDPLVGAQVRNALISKADELFRNEDPKNRASAPQRFADALEQLICNSDGAGVPAGVELIILADYDLVHERVTNARLADGTLLTEAEILAIACDAKILPGIFNKHTGNVLLGRSQRKISKRLRKRLIARDGGCIGCGAHEKICQGHHVDHWCDDGETSYENTCLLCWRCHHIRVHRHGEQVVRHANGRFTLQPQVDTHARAGPADATGAGQATRPDLPTQRAPDTGHPPATSQAPGAEPSAVAGQAAGHPKPRRHEPERPRKDRPPMSGHRRGPPKPESTPTGHASLPFPASRTATARDAEH